MARRWHNAVLTATALLPFAVASAFAGPNGAHVVGGAATVQGQGTGNVVVNQSSQNAIINWQTFNIGSGETTKILMPNSSSTQLDRVTGGQGPSQILGTLYSNGKIFLVNPDGILFGMGASINVGSLLATTNNITNKNFMAGRYQFTIPGNPNASIVNMGSITAQTGGFAALVAPGVRNTGTITAKLGTIALASGNAFTLDMYGDNLITLGLTDSISSQVVDVATGQPLKSLVSNEGKLKANGGTVTLTAAAARAVVDSVINNSGVIEANSIGSHNSMIVLGAATATTKPPGSPTQTVTVSGKLSAKGKRKGTTGGTIIVTGENIAVSGASINASGKAGGGTVLIGGDWGGGHPNTSLVSGNASAMLQPYAVPNSSTVSIDAATTIDASATATGNGGKVIVWANQATTFLGTILAKGGAQSGNGGFVETSSHGVLDYAGTVDVRAPAGTTGTLLLDPYDVTICQTDCGENISNSDFTFSPTGSPSYLQASTLEAALSTANVIVMTGGAGSAGADAGNINVNTSLTWNASTPGVAGRIVDSYDAGCGPDAPPDAHGTGMAGAIASHVGLLGVAPDARIIAICAFGGRGSPEATSAKIIHGVDYAIAHGAKIINMSFAGPQDPALAQELQIAREKGILIIAAAGNAGAKSPPLYPGADPNVMAVTATDEHDRLFNGANQGSYVTVAAPGVNILVPAPNGDVQFTTGTSVASANVSGVAALLLAEKPTRTPEEIRAILASTAKHLGAKGVNPQFGAGLVDPLKALRFVPTVPGSKPTAQAAPLQPH